MSRFLVFLFLLVVSISCSKSDSGPPPTDVIPDDISGIVLDLAVTPLNITTPDKGSFSIFMSGIIYKVEFNAVSQAQSNATLFFDTDSILRTDSREFANLGKDAVAYNPVGPNDLTIRFTDGRKIFGSFDANTSFGGVFGEALITQWRNPTDPAKPNQKAKDDISNFVKLYRDSNGTGPGIIPVYLSVQVSKQ